VVVVENDKAEADGGLISLEYDIQALISGLVNTGRNVENDEPMDLRKAGLEAE